MGEVYQATDSKLDRNVALKLLPAAFASDAERLSRFRREAQLLASLNHPNIAHIYGLEESGDMRCIVMELVEGETLQARIQRGPIPVDAAIIIAKQIAEALEAAHEKGVVHRDLKPGNVMLTSEGKVKVLDFGLAKAYETNPLNAASSNSPTLASMAATNAGVILGTAAYMSPEQARGKNVDKRADIWAFGVVLYESVTGSLPFRGTDVSEIMASVIKEHPDYEPLPQELRRLIKKCLEKDPAKRLRDIGDVWELIEAPPPVAIEPASLPSAKRPVLAWAVAAALAVAVAGLAVLAVLHFREEPPRLVKLQFPPPEKGSIVQGSGPPAVSPDGRRVAFRANADGKNMLWIRDLDSLATRALAGTENGAVPFWAPDSRTLGFVANGKLMKIDVTGGPAVTITNAPAGVRGATWNRDDVIVFAPASGGLAQVAAAGGTATPVTEIDESRKENSHRNPWFLPDGRHFLYVARSSNAEQTAIFVGDLESTKSKKLVLQAASNVQYVEPSRGNGYLLFVRERTLMAQPFDAAGLTTTGDARPIAEQVDVPSAQNLYGYFSASLNGVLAYTTGGSAGGALQIRWHDRSGKVVGTVGKPADINNPRLSPDGKMVATDRLDAPSGNRDIWLLDLARGTEQRLTFTGNNNWPVWSPDGLRIAFRRASEQKVMVRAANGTGADEVLEAADKLPTDWTRDGGFLLSATPNTIPKTGNDIWAMPLSGGDRKPLALRQTEFVEWHARVSPDGRWMAYLSNESKRDEVYVVGFPALNGKWQISANGGGYPVWSRDGRELYFVGADDKLMAVPITPGPQFQPGIPQPLFDVRLANANSSYDVSADGRVLVATPVEQSVTVPMTVVLNWQQALKK